MEVPGGGGVNNFEEVVVVGGGGMCGHKGDQEAPEVKQTAVAMVGVIGRVTRIHAEAVAVEKMFTPGC